MTEVILGNHFCNPETSKHTPVRTHNRNIVSSSLGQKVCPNISDWNMPEEPEHICFLMLRLPSLSALLISPHAFPAVRQPALPAPGTTPALSAPLGALWREVCLRGLLWAPPGAASSPAEPQLGPVSSQGLCFSPGPAELPPVPPAAAHPALREGEKLLPSIYCLWNDLRDCSLPLLPMGLIDLSYLFPFRQQSQQIVILCIG